MNRGSRYIDSVRIVQIDTHFVETDAVNFRAVVQSLTGKNSPAVFAGNGLPSPSSSSFPAAAETDNDNNNANGADDVAVKPAAAIYDQGMMMVNKGGEVKYEDDDYVLSFMKVNNLSFKDFDRLLSEFALMEELPLL